VTLGHVSRPSESWPTAAGRRPNRPDPASPTISPDRTGPGRGGVVPLADILAEFTQPGRDAGRSLAAAVDRLLERPPV
jgi:hypothetical protein